MNIKQSLPNRTVAAVVGVVTILFASSSLAQIRNPAWLSIVISSETESYIDINNISRSGDQAAFFTINFSSDRQPINRQNVSYVVSSWIANCRSNRMALSSITYFNNRGGIIEDINSDDIDYRIVSPGSVGAGYFNVACHPRSDVVTPSASEVATALNKRRGLNADGRPAFPVGTVVVVDGAGLAVAGPSGYLPVQGGAEIAAVEGIPIGLRVFLRGEGMIEYNGNEWVDASNPSETIANPDLSEIRRGTVRSAPYRFDRGWRPYVWPMTRTYINGEMEIFPKDIAMFWGDQFWYGLITEDTTELVRDWEEKQRR